MLSAVITIFLFTVLKKYRAFEYNPSNPLGLIGGVYTCTGGLPSNGSIIAVAVDELRIVVLTGAPLTVTTEVGLKYLPFTVTVKLVLPINDESVVVRRLSSSGVGEAKLFTAASACIKP